MKWRELEVNLTKKQGELYHAFNDNEIKEIWFGGWWRGGKTWGICEIINMTCISFPGIAWAVWRKEWDDLRKSSLVTLQKVLTKHKLVNKKDYTLNLQTKTLEYYNGSRIFFIPLKQQPTDPEFNFLWGYELTFGFVDEAQEVSRKAIDVLMTRFTEKIREYNLVGKIILWCNPMKGHLYFDFIKPSKEGTLKKNRVFIQSLYSDNPYIDREAYEKNYENADVVTKERILRGNWEYDDRPQKLIKYDDICDLFTNPITNGEKYISCDVAGEGKDKAVVIVWNGFEAIDFKVFDKCSALELQDCIKQFAQKYTIGMSQVVCDQDGIGWGVVGNLQCKWFQNNLTPIDNRTDYEKQEQWGKPFFQNLKTQCYFELKKVIESHTMNLSSMTIHRTTIIEELDIIDEVDIDKDGVRKINSKEKQKEILWRSPDFADCLMMRMFFEIQKEVQVYFIPFSEI